MTISSSVRVAGPYTGTGSVSTYPFAFKVFQASDVLVKQTDLSGNVTTLALTTDYSVALSSDQNANPGGSINLNTPLPNGYQLVISSQVQELQGTSLTNNGGFYPNVIENALDYLTILVQQAQTEINASLQVPLGGSTYDAGGRRIINGADAVGATDFTTQQQVDKKVTAAAGGLAPADVALYSQLGSTASGAGAALIGYLTGTVKSFLDSLSTAGSAVGAYLIGFIQAATGAVARTVQDKLRERVSVEDYGPIDGVHDNATILAAIAAAESLGAVLEFRSKSYTVAGPFVITTAIGGIDGGGATINGSSATSDCFQFSAGNYSGKKFIFPNVFSFPSGYAVNLQGANLLYGYMDTVLACKGAFLLTATSANNNVLDVTLKFNSVANCTESAIKYAAYNNSTVMQGNNFFGNFVDNCGAWVTMTGATSASLNDNFHWCGAVDGASLAGSVAISCNGATIGQNIYEVPGFFGGFATTPYVSNVGNGNHFRITGFSTIGYADMSIGGIGNEVKSMGSAGGYRTSAVAAATATNSRATYNSGTALGKNLINVSFAIPAMSSEGIVDFYMYSPFTDGYSDKFFLQPHFSQPLVVQCVEDASVIAGIDGNASANQIHIRLLAVGTVTSHTTYATLFTFG